MRGMFPTNPVIQVLFVPVVIMLVYLWTLRRRT
jgi:hypothetical protein